MQGLIGRTLSHYRIVEHLGGGGMGVVYKAEDTKLGRTVALKFLPPEWSRDPDARERFLREARAASALEDSRICTIHDIDETDDGQLFIAMAFYEGESLKKRLERGRLPIGEAVDIAIQVAEGLERAHSAEIVHRDIKPANLMLTGHDEVVIVDFGLAKLAGDLTLTKPGSSLGTPHYMSPEQSRGERLDARTDLWSLGVVLFEMLTGERPFAGENHTSVARSILDDEVPDVRKLRPDAPASLGAIVAKALEKNVDRRYRSAGELLADLRNLKEGLSEFEGVTLSAPSQSPLPGRFPLAPVLIALALVVGTAAVIWYLGRADSDQPSEAPSPRIVVLPFENLGPPEHEYFADGITEEITARLSSVKGLRVISRTSAIQYAGSKMSIGQMGEELGVGYVLEGTVRWADSEGDSRIRITPQLIRVADDTHLWAQTYDRIADNIFDIQSEIAEHVTDHLGIALTGPGTGDTQSQPTENFAAYQAYLRGRYYEARPHFTIEDWNQAIAAYQKAVDLDPDFALAYAHLAKGHARLRYLRHDLTPERLLASDAAAARAVELAPDSPRVRLAVGYNYLWAHRDVAKALAEFDLAAVSLPANAEVLVAKSDVFILQGHFEDALAVLQDAFELSPRDADVATMVGEVLWTIRRYPEAVAAADQAINLAPDAVWPYLIKTFALWSWRGSAQETRAVLEALPTDDGSWQRWTWYWQEVFEGRYRDALHRLESAPDGWIRIKILARPVELFSAQVHELLNQPELAVDEYERARELLEAAVRESPEDPRLHSSLGIACAALGFKEEALSEGRRATELLPKYVDGFYYLPFAVDLAHIYTIVGDDEAALDEIEELLSNPSWVSTSWLEMDPRWNPLRDHPRFQALLEKYEIEE
jgi:serine/threonine protein kinase/Flp pilus assembly protein TadD